MKARCLNLNTSGMRPRARLQNNQVYILPTRPTLADQPVDRCTTWTSFHRVWLRSFLMTRRVHCTHLVEKSKTNMMPAHMNMHRPALVCMAVLVQV